jgi:hypothetical protein
VNANTTGDQTLQELALPAGLLNTLNQPTLIRSAGIMTIGAAQTPALTFKAKLCTVSGCGSGTVITLASMVSAASVTATNNGWTINLLSITTATGASGTIFTHGYTAVDIGALTSTPATVYTDTNTATSSAIDLTAALFIDFTIATSAGSTTNSFSGQTSTCQPNPSASAVTSVALNSGTAQTGAANLTSSSTGTYAALPSCTAAITGAVYWPSDSFYALRCSGSTWAYFGPNFPMTDPNLQSWSWVNQTSATVSSTNGGIILTGTANAGINIQGRFTTIPAAPYTVTMGAIPLLQGTQYNNCGMALRNSSSGKLVTLDLFAGLNASVTVAPAFFIGGTKFASPTGANDGDYISFKGVSLNGPLIFFRFKDDNTNRTFWVSTDGVNFLQLFSVGRTDYITPDQIGFMCNSYNSNLVPSMTVLSWLVQ